MPIRTMLPYDGTPTAAVWKSRILRQYRGLEKFRDLRHKNFADVMYETEEALIPFPGGDSPIRYPEAEFWHRITVERKKYVLDLGNNPAEQKIIDELDNETRMTFFDQPLKDVIDTINDMVFRVYAGDNKFSINSWDRSDNFSIETDKNSRAIAKKYEVNII